MNRILCFIITIILLLLTLLLLIRYRQEENYTLQHGKNICIVGNGPLSKEDRKFINSNHCDEVWRFNDMKNMEYGERCDGQFIRDNGKTYSGLEIRSKFDINNIPIIAIKGGDGHWFTLKRLLWPLFNFLDSNKVLPKEYTKKIIDINNPNFKLYNNCTKCPNDCKANSYLKFTSGAIGISYFQDQQNVENIHILGMNFIERSFLKVGHEMNEKSFLDSCCTKCNIHKTYKNTYLP
tara:strand:+ start:5968 stop:6675 length:708 start_codon:yes stop_codon:yes gene_type:complete